MTTALVLIDLQNSMLTTEGELPYQPEETLAAARLVLDKARVSGAPVIHVQHEDASYELMRPGSPGFEIHERVAPADGETVIVKRSSDAFEDTPLADLLREFGADRIVVAGMQTELCVDTSCRRALAEEFEVTLVSDAHTTWDSKHAPAAIIIAHHNATLANLPHARHEIITKPASEVEF